MSAPEQITPSLNLPRRRGKADGVGAEKVAVLEQGGDCGAPYCAAHGGDVGEEGGAFASTEGAVGDPP